MTIKQIMTRLKQLQAQDPVETVRAVLEGITTEHTVYPPAGKWVDILKSLNLSADRAVCVTGYATDASFTNTVAKLLKKKFPAVLPFAIDDWRTVYLCGESQDKPPTIIACINYYESPREQVKSQYRSESEDAATDAEADDIEDIDLEDNDTTNPFA